MSISSKPARASLATYSYSCSAPAMQPNPHFHAAAHLFRHVAADNHVGDGEAAAGLQDAEGFAQDLVLVGREINHAIRNDDIDGVVGQGNVFDFALQKLDVLDSGLALVLAGEGQHFIGHVEAVSFAGGADAPGGQQHVDAASGAEIEDGFAGIELGQGGRIAATQRSEDSLFGDLPGLDSVVQIGRDRIDAAAVKARARSATGASASGDAQRGLAVFLFDDLFDFHDLSSLIGAR